MNDALLAVAEKKQPLEEEKAIRDAILSVMTDDVETNQDIIDNVTKELGEKGADYLEYFNDLNAYLWATEERNSSWIWEDSWWEGEELKVAIEKKYGDNFWEDVWNVISFDEVEDGLTYSEAATKQLVKDLQEKEVTLQAKQSAILAAKAAVEAATAMDTAAQKAAEIATAATAAQAAADALAAAEADVAAKKAEVEALKAKLAAARHAMNDIKAAADELETAKLDLTEAENKVEDAQDKLNEANNNLKETRAAAAAAQNYANWANALVDEQKMSAFVQLAKDENGNLVPATSNGKNFDINNANVAGRPTTDFDPVSGKNSVKVPYAIYRDFVEVMYEIDYNTIKNSNQGKGTTTGDNMTVVYWSVDEKGQLTGEYTISEAELETGRYFVGYVFKSQGDGYHLDGIMVDYEKPENEPEVVPPTDDEEPTPITGGGEDRRSSRSSRSASDAAVLGAKREQEGLVPEGQVLGAVRAPKTSDSSKAILWMLVMGGSALGAAAVLAQKKKEEA